MNASTEHSSDRNPLPADSAPAVSTRRYSVEGMHCASCVRRVESALGGVAGVATVSVHLGLREANVTCSGATPDTPLLAAAQAVGYTLRRLTDDPFTADADSQATSAVSKDEASPGPIAHASAQAARFPWTLLTAAMLSAGVMAWCMIPALAQHPGSAWWQLGLSLPVVLGLGGPFFRHGGLALLRGRPDMNSLVALGVGTSFVASLVSLAFPQVFVTPHAHSGHASHGPVVWFESATMILLFVSIGRWLEERARLQTAGAIAALVRLAPEVARVERGGQVVVLPVAQVRVGETVHILPGERIPVDGLIVSGRTVVNESMLTGESLPVARHEGERVFAGTLNTTNPFRCQVDRSGRDTMLARIIQLVRVAQTTKAPIQRLADDISAWFVPAVVTIALLALFVWGTLGPSENAWRMAITTCVSVLVVACPCALGLATPTALTVGIGRGSELGILIRSGETLERLARISTVLFDKTGTLTIGSPTVCDIVPRDGRAHGPGEPLDGAARRLLTLAASLELTSEHPLSRGIVAAARQHGLGLWASRDGVATPGLGFDGTVFPGEPSVAVPERPVSLEAIEAQKSRSGPVVVPLLLKLTRPADAPEPVRESATAPPREAPVRVLVGNERLFAARGVETACCEAGLRQVARRGGTPVMVAADGVAIGVIGLADQLRENAPSVVAALRRRGLAIGLISGDREEAVQHIARAAGIDDAHARLLPEDKSDQIRDRQSRGERVGMVGDGINDGPALARADVGIAVGVATDVAIEASDVSLPGRDLTGVVAAIDLARATLRTIRTNLALAFVYNVLAIPVAAGALYPTTGWLLDPMLSSAAMSLSSFVVVSNSLRLRHWFPSECPP